MQSEIRCDGRSYITIATARLHTHTQPKMPPLIVSSISSGGGGGRRRPTETSESVTGLPTRQNIQRGAGP